MSRLEETFAMQLRALKLEPPTREHRFAPPRRWRFDFAWIDRKLAVEIDGGTYVNGRHNRAAGFQADCEKMNAAAMAGWRVLRFTGADVKSGAAVDTVAQVLKFEKCPRCGEKQ